MKQPEPFGKFLLYGQVAVGGMAEIYKARYADPSMPQMDIMFTSTFIITQKQ